MVLGILGTLYTKYFPAQYALHIITSILVVYVLRAFSQGRKSNRERDLHARTVLVTGGFTPLGLTLLQNLAKRGAHIIALTEQPEESPSVTILVDLLRSSTSNKEIYAEECNLSSPTSIRRFCTKFLTGKDQRLDAIIFAHEHKHIGSPSPLSTSSITQNQKFRDENSLATFLITTLLIPALLVAPPERDIRIVNVVNPFYAATTGQPFSPSFVYEGASRNYDSLFLREGHRSLRTVILTRHLQRVLDALPHGSQPPKPEGGSNTVPVVASKLQGSNIVAVSVSPGLSRDGTVFSLLNADWSASSKFSYLGIYIYMFLQPILLVLTKSSTAAIQTILHALFLPTPFKVFAQATESLSKNESQSTTKVASNVSIPGEVLKPGALYADCAMVRLKIDLPPAIIEADKRARPKSEDGNNKEDQKGKIPLSENVLDVVDDGEYGGELAGRLVWESYEQAVKSWEKDATPTERDKQRENTDGEEVRSNTTTTDSETGAASQENYY